MPSMEKIGLALSGFGAGYRGGGTEFLKMQQNKNTALSEERKTAAAQDLYKAHLMLDQEIKNANAGGGPINLGPLNAFAETRVGAINKLGGDPSDTMAEMASINNDPLAALEAQRQGLMMAQSQGYIALPANFGPQKKTTFQLDLDSANLTPEQRQRAIKANLKIGDESPEEIQDRNLRERDIAVKEMIANRQETKLSAGAETALLGFQSSYNSSTSQANGFLSLAAEFDKNPNLTAGLASTLTEFGKQAAGTEDYSSQIRRDFIKLRNSGVMESLPPGVASDVDVALALKGFPADNANAKTIAQWARGAAKLARFQAANDRFSADYISQKGGSRGLLRRWEKPMKAPKTLPGGEKSPALKGVIRLSEIYLTAVNRGVTPREVATKFGFSEEQLKEMGL